jgi:hypothetical protein
MDFSDRMGMKIFMCANHAHDPLESSLLFYRAPVSFKFHEMTYISFIFRCISNIIFVAVAAAALPMVSLDRHGAAGLGVASDRRKAA